MNICLTNQEKLFSFQKVLCYTANNLIIIKEENN